MANVVVQAKLKNVAHAPRKIGEVVALIRNRSVEEAMTILSHTPRKAAKTVGKLIASAKANAENNHNVDTANLVIKEITVGPGVRYKRYRPAARGRALPYTRQRSNVLVRVEGPERAKKTETKKSDDKKSSKTTTKGKVTTTVKSKSRKSKKEKK